MAAKDSEAVGGADRLWLLLCGLGLSDNFFVLLRSHQVGRPAELCSLEIIIGLTNDQSDHRPALIGFSDQSGNSAGQTHINDHARAHSR